jgi:hypothetical protein
MANKPLKSGEKILFSIFGVFFILACAGYVILEVIRSNTEGPMYEQTTFFDFSPEGKIGAGLYLTYNCNACHRSLRSGTSMGLSLDGIGSKRSLEWLEQFLVNPEAVYGAPTLDHGGKPKEASYVSNLSGEDRRHLAVYLSQLKANAGSSVAKVPPPERSGFIDAMVKSWAPDEWKGKYEDVRDRLEREQQEAELRGDVNE